MEKHLVVVVALMLLACDKHNVLPGGACTKDGDCKTGYCETVAGIWPETKQVCAEKCGMNRDPCSTGMTCLPMDTTLTVTDQYGERSSTTHTGTLLGAGLCLPTDQIPRRVLDALEAAHRDYGRRLILEAQ